MHRVSGLWLAERAGLGESGRTIAGAVADLVRFDKEPVVRARARRTAGRLLVGMAGETGAYPTPNE